MRIISYSTSNILKGLAILIYTLLVLGITAWINFYFKNAYVALASILISILFLLSSFIFYKKLNLFGKGIDGEDTVYKILKQLPVGYTFLHDIKLDKFGNIDFVVVGPNGIFAIEVKNYNDINIDNQYLNQHLSQAYAEAKSLEEFLSQPVYPILVFTNPKTIVRFGHNKQRGVYVIGKSWLLDLIQNGNYSHPLSPEQGVQIYQELKKFTSGI